MSSGGGTLTAALPVTPTSKPKAHAPRRKPVTENWDDDFEFSLPVKNKSGSTSASSPVATTTPKRDHLPLIGESRFNGLSQTDSPDSFDEDWDEPLEPLSLSGPGPSRSASIRSATRPPRSPLAPAHAHLHPPRSSHSQSPNLPSPTASTSSWKVLGFPSSCSSSSLATARPGDSARPTLSKRSSTSFVPVRQGDLSPLAAHKHLPMARSSPNLAEKMASQAGSSSSSVRRIPLPPLSPGDISPVPSPRRRHSPAKSVPTGAIFQMPASGTSSPVKGFPSPLKGTPVSTKTLSSTRSARSTASSPAIKPSPSHENLREKRPSFWKRLSSGPSGSSSKESSPDKSPGRRKRSSSVGAGLVPVNDEPVPPLPPLPANLRSPSSTSGFSSPQRLPSTTSIQSSSGKSKTKRITAPFMMRRSSSNMSYDSPSKPGKSDQKGLMMQVDQRSTPSVNGSPVANHSLPMSPSYTPSMASLAQFSSPAASPTRSVRDGMRKASGSRTFSPGFHLPSPSPGSPYSRVGSPSSTVSLNPNEGEVELTDEQKKSRQRVRPTSAMPIPRKQGSAISLNAQASASVHSFASTSATSVPRTVHMPTLEALSKGGTSRQASASSYQQTNASPISTTRSVSSSHLSVHSTSATSHTGIAAQTQSTLRRLTSFSKKHGRRLSGGWKLSNGPSASHEQRLTGNHLATVDGSPSKPSPVEPAQTLLAKPKATFPGDEDFDFELGSPPLLNGSRQGESQSDVDWDETTKSRGTRERRRLSFNDFVIPDQVLAKQKELKRGIGAVKKFAGGVQSLKQLVAAHDTVCDNVLAAGTQEDMTLFVSLENEYTQWWEMATVLIEVGSTGTEDSTAVPVRQRRITLATDDARAAGEALSSISSRGASYSTVKSIFTDGSDDVFGSDVSDTDPESRSSTGKHDLSQRQLEVLRTMLRTPVSASDSVVATVDQQQALKARLRQSMPAAPTKDREVLPSAPATVRAANGPMKQTPVQTPALPSRSSPDQTYIVPSPNYPSPETAAQLAQPRNKGGLAGLRDFLRSLKTASRDGGATPKARRTRPTSQPARRRPAPINVQAAEKFGHSPPGSPLPSAGSSVPMVYGNSAQGSIQSNDMGSVNTRIKMDNKKRRPSLKNIFRPSSGNWHDLARATPPASPLPTIPSQGTPDEPKTSIDGASIISTTPSRHRNGSLARPPSIPAFARLKLTKPYGSISADTPTATPTVTPSKTPRHRASVGMLDASASISASPSSSSLSRPRPSSPDGEATLRLKSRILGLGHPSEASPSRASSSPARGAPNELGGLEDAPRSRSDGGVRDADDPVIALTPENLPVLLDYVKQCEKKLKEWRARAVSLENPL